MSPYGKSAPVNCRGDLVWSPANHAQINNYPETTYVSFRRKEVYQIANVIMPYAQTNKLHVGATLCGRPDKSKRQVFFCRELSVTVSRQDVHCISERSRTVPYKRLIKQILRRRATTQGRPYAHPQNNIRFQITMNLDNSVILIFCDFPNRP